MRIVKTVLFAAILMSVVASSQTTQSWDSSGNGMLSGQYYIRQVLWQIGDNAGDLGDAASVYGVITFSGTGTYSFTGQSMDPGNASTPQPFSTTGNYTISASGYGFMDNLLIGPSETVFGLVSQGIFIGSSTENLSTFGVNDLVIAAPLASPLPTNATFKGNYTLIDFDSPDGTIYNTRSSLFTLTADGNGNLTGTTAGTGFIAGNGGPNTRQNISGVKYLFSNGGANVQFPGSITNTNISSTLLAGNHYLYFSPDGSFFFGGSPNGWDMIIGIRTPTGAPSAFSGLYYQAGMDQDESNLGLGFANLDSYFGSFKAGSGTIYNHQRVLSVFNNSAFDFTFKDGYAFNSDGSSDDAVTSQHYLYSSNGGIRIGIGVYPFLGINVALAAPTFSGPGTFLDPTGVVNSASFSLFTSSVSPGEFLTLFGTNLSSKNDVSSSFPTTLDGVQVLINGTPAPIYYVFGNAISVLMPYEVTGGIANIQVNNNGNKSNIVSVFVGLTSPGAFTQTQDGVGYVAAQHTTNFTTITPSNPAVAGEIIAVYMTGLGAVAPALQTGSITPGVLTNATSQITAYIGGLQAVSGYAGLTPGLIGLYQMNVTVPSGLTPGDNIFEITGPDSDNFESKIPIGAGSTGVNAVPQALISETNTARPSMVARPHIGRVSKGLPSKIEPLTGRPIRPN
jgi:uncharacterized protein (TIGR03437 family)